MAKAKTGSFYLTESVILPAASADGTVVQGTIDLGAYVNVPTGQAIAIEGVDFVYQLGSTMSSDIAGMLQANGSLQLQLSDLNPGTSMLIASNQSLVASGAINIDRANNLGTHTSDMYPDNFGPAALSEAFMVVNDTLYVTLGNFGAISNATTQVVGTVRVRARVVKLSSEDWMAIAIQSTASDN